LTATASTPQRCELDHVAPAAMSCHACHVTSTDEDHVMATHDLDTYIDFLRQELPDMPVLAMPGVRHVGLMHCALPSRGKHRLNTSRPADAFV